MLERFFRLKDNNTTLGTEVLAGLTTFLTMAYIIVVQPGVLSGVMIGGLDTGMSASAVMTATCVAAAIATGLMGLLARLPIAQAPGMGANFIFAAALIPAADAMIRTAVENGQLEAGVTTGWQVALGVIFYAGLAFLLLSLLGVRQLLMGAVSRSMWSAISVGIGLFIAFIGLKGVGLIVADPGTFVAMTPTMANPDIVVFFLGLFITAGLYCRNVPGSIILGMLATALIAAAARQLAPSLPAWLIDPETLANSMLMTHFTHADGIVAPPPSLAPTLFQFDLMRSLWKPMLPFLFIFLYLDVFDTMGTLAGVLRHAGLAKDGEIPRARAAFVSDAVGTVAGAALGTSTVTSYIESAAGVQQGGRTGLTSLVVAGCFLLALFFSPIVTMMGSYSVITAPALVLVGAMMMSNIRDVEWSNAAEALPAFLTFLLIPLTFSIANGMAIGFISYPVVKLLAGQGRDVRIVNWVLAAVLVCYLTFVG